MAEYEERYKHLIRTSPAPINLFDASGEIIWGNDAVLDLLGLDSREALIGRSIFEFIDSQDRETAEAELASVVESKVATGPTPMQLVRDDGEVRSIHVATAPGEYNDRDIGQAVVIDVTDRNQLAQQLTDEQAFIQDALDVLDDVFYVLSPAGELERWNDSLLEVSGYTPAEVDEMAVNEFFIPAHAERVGESIARALVEGSDTIEATISTKSGERIPYEFRKHRLIRNREIIGLVGIGRNITQRKSREQHLRAVDYLLQHHLRNQLNVIQGRSDLLADAAGDAGTTHQQAVDRAADTMISIFDHHREVVDSLLADADREVLDIVSITDSLFEDLQAEYPSAEFSLDAPGAALVYASPRIRYAFHELFCNALKHSGATSPLVAVSISTDTSPVTITVTDNGPPISSAEYAFMEDVSLLEATTHPSGFGLWAVNLAIKHSHGSLTIDHTLDHGNTITIELPTPNRD